MIVIDPADESELSGLLGASEYQAFTQEQSGQPE
jgi:hypothetical protein